MTKTSDKKCPKCNKPCKTRYGLTNHLKEKKKKIYSETRTCPFCHRKFLRRNYQMHVVACESNILFNKYLKFFDFLCKLIVFYNRENEKNAECKFNNEKKYVIFTEKTKNMTEEEKRIEEYDLKNNTNYIIQNIEYLNDYFKKIKKEKELLFNDLKVKNTSDNIILFNLIRTVISGENINQSFRQIVFSYFDKRINKIDVKRNFFKKINRRYSKKDFFTNNEINSKNIELASKVFSLMERNSEYEQKYNYYYNFLKEFDKNNNKYKCIFCCKFYLHKWNHFKKCKCLRKSFYLSVGDTFYLFVMNYFKSDITDKLVLSEIIKKYLTRDFDFFIYNIRDNILNCGAFESEYEFLKCSFKYKNIVIDNEKLENFLNELYNEYGNELNIIDKRNIRKFTIEYYSEKGKYNKREIRQKINNYLHDKKLEIEKANIIEIFNNEIKINNNSEIKSNDSESINENKEEEKDPNILVENSLNEEYEENENEESEDENELNECIRENFKEFMIDNYNNNKKANKENKIEFITDPSQIKKNNENDIESLSFLNNII